MAGGFDFADYLSRLPVVAYETALDANYTLRYVSAEAVKMLGYPPELFLGDGSTYTPASVVHPADLSLVDKGAELQVSGVDFIVSRFRLIHASGAEVPVLDIARTLRHADGSVRGSAGVFIDLRKLPMLQGPPAILYSGE